MKYIQAKPSDTSYYFYAYLAIVLIAEYSINASITKNICGEYQGLTAFISTLLPWGIIFGTFVMLLSLMPGWLSPFSNTFGYSAALMGGLNETLKKILIETKADTIDKSDIPLHEAISHIYSDKSLLINEVTPENFDIFWDNMKRTFKANALTDDGVLKKELLSFIGLKDSVAKLIWYILVGVLVTSISYNSLIDSTCVVGSSSAKLRNEQFDLELATEQDKARNQPTKREYKIN